MRVTDGTSAVYTGAHPVQPVQWRTIIPTDARPIDRAIAEALRIVPYGHVGFEVQRPTYNRAGMPLWSRAVARFVWNSAADPEVGRRSCFWAAVRWCLPDALLAAVGLI